jgi:hypothetical protein
MKEEMFVVKDREQRSPRSTSMIGPRARTTANAVFRDPLASHDRGAVRTVHRSAADESSKVRIVRLLGRYTLGVHRADTGRAKPGLGRSELMKSVPKGDGVHCRSFGAVTRGWLCIVGHARRPHRRASTPS